MTIEETINIAKSDIKYNKSIGCDTSYEEQLAEWLEELKALKIGLKIKCDSLNEALEKGKKIGSNKAIDDFVNQFNVIVDEKCGTDTNNYFRKIVKEIAEQLKAGEDNV